MAVPTELNHEMAAGTLDVSVISAVEYARDAKRYLLLPDLSICSDGPGAKRRACSPNGPPPSCTGVASWSAEAR
jgi:hypothetical protein